MVGLSNPIRPLVASLALLLRDMKRGRTTVDHSQHEQQSLAEAPSSVIPEQWEARNSAELRQTRSKPLRQKQQWLMGRDLPSEASPENSWEPTASTSVNPAGNVNIDVSLPGVTASEVDVGLRRRVLMTVSGISAGRVFHREVSLPPGVDADSVTASMSNGTLSIRAHTAEHSEEHPRRVSVESA
ncbi:MULTISPECIES: Hsp20/alpha crystallin family protein [Actinopolyspora]|nr:MULTISPECIES: Hsp20/alpha crystallin family protein [Actinopolyspora]NHD15884.1 Hsp20/alpha crystallin family protein [Actinopolyspora sp. BKK2]NHE74902.1 Hsp20/alpha crystallin family protein [Actinopolyspora sp. BKK1]